MAEQQDPQDIRNAKKTTLNNNHKISYVPHSLKAQMRQVTDVSWYNDNPGDTGKLLR